MQITFAFLLESALFGFALAMDAFSVSVVNGMNEPRMSLKRSSKIAGIFSLFQFAMPLLGWLCIHTILETFAFFETLIPWIAFVLLIYLGGKMVYEGLHPTDTDTELLISTKQLLLQGVATSIDALSVGFTIAKSPITLATVEALIIGVVTFVICMIGLSLGKRIGTKISHRATIVGGIILIIIGIQILIR